MGMFDALADRVSGGAVVEFRPSGSSMVPLVRSRQRVVVGPVDPRKLEIGDIVLARVAGTVYLHLVSAVDGPGERVQISNNRGRVNGWTSHDRVFGICLSVDGVLRPGAEAKTLGPTIRAEAIGTERLELLPLVVDHAQEMAAALSDPALHAFIGGAPDTPQDLRARYRRMVSGSPDPAVSWCNWVIRLHEERCLVGTVQATIGPSGDGLDAEIAWVVGAPWQGRGIASEAALGLVAWLEGLERLERPEGLEGLEGLERRPVHSLVAHVHPDHGASAAVAAACGLSPTGRWHDGEIRWQRNLR
jgi:RimJ/RimL family protein N-acetyltransferase